MALPSSGPISLGDVRTELGQSGSIDMNATNVRTLLQARYSNPVSMGNGYGEALYHDFDDSTFISPYGNGVYSQPLTISDYFSAGQLSSGSDFRVTGKILNTGWAYYTPYSWDMTKGTGVTTDPTPFASSKQYYMRANYLETTDQVRIYGYYCCDSTSFPNGQVTISRIELIL